ncbi:MAG: DUF5119 domain-containing protein [Bacteroidaceae bacterium]|nr:DUF5119 domain-containing protein [Bacteroidaceae bacterium]
MKNLLTYLIAPLFVTLSTFIDCGGLRPLNKDNGPVDDERSLTLYFDWSEMEEKPTGMTVFLYPIDGGTPYRYISNQVDSMTVVVPLDDYKVMVFNQTVEEFPELGFRGLDAVMSAEIYVPESSNLTRGYNTSARLKGGSVATKSTSTPAVVRSVVDYAKMYIKPEIRIFDMNVIVHVKGLEYAKKVWGTVSGLASGFMMGVEELDTESLTQELYDWKIDRPVSGGVGTISTTFGTFGIPHLTDETSGSANVDLELFFELKDETVAIFKFPVQNYIKVRHDGQGSRLEINLELGTDVSGNIPPLELPESSNGNFNLHPWGPTQDFDIVF